MSRFLCHMTLLLLVAVALTAAQGFYSQRYGKRGDSNREITVRSGFYANRYGRSPPHDLPEIKVRSSRFIGGSRYGKRSGPADVAPIMTSEAEEAEMPATFLVGESVVCLLIDVPDIYRCIRKSASEESTN
ncbi:uncharacterized protein LOC119579264 isoform X1 [Penaeus monodon]|uniref:uncharacterized protein LOC119579264 isoform X1 n=1 Tax=Penaeus monodon TaxID=6687 RepID=UPI0018A7694E|nr:uncharacterized protein LOC119579264 isoform X1 [Penaeus monodon]